MYKEQRWGEGQRKTQPPTLYLRAPAPPRQKQGLQGGSHPEGLAGQTAKEAGRKQPSTRSTRVNTHFPGTSLRGSLKGIEQGPTSPAGTELQAALETDAEQRARP